MFMEFRCPECKQAIIVVFEGDASGNIDPGPNRIVCRKCNWNGFLPTCAGRRRPPIYVG